MIFNERSSNANFGVFGVSLVKKRQNDKLNLKLIVGHSIRNLFYAPRLVS